MSDLKFINTLGRIVLIIILVVGVPLFLSGVGGILFFDGINDYNKVDIEGSIQQDDSNITINIDDKSDNVEKIVLSNDERNVTYDITQKNRVLIEDINNTGEYTIHALNNIDNYKEIAEINTDNETGSLDFESSDRNSNLFILFQIGFGILMIYFSGKYIKDLIKSYREVSNQ